MLNLRTSTLGTKELVLKGGPPSVDGEQSNRKFNQINCEHHQLIVQKKGPTFTIIQLFLEQHLNVNSHYKNKFTKLM